VSAKARNLRAIGLVTAILAVLVAAGSVGALQLADSGHGHPGGYVPGPQLPTPIKHVFLILMENEQTSIIYNNQPFETQLANTYGWGGDANTPSQVGYWAVCHPSAPNYLALTSGQPLQCGSDGYSTYPVQNLGNELQTAGESWVAYEESATQPCQEATAGLYAVKHNPFPYYSDLGGNATGSVCDTHVLPIANLSNDYDFSATPPAFTYIAPNILNDGHSSSAATGDWWLSTFIPKLVAEPYFHSSVVFIVYDEAYDELGDENFTGYNGLEGGPVYMVAASPYTEGVGALTFNSSHYDLLSTMEWLLGLPGTGANDSTVAFPALPKLFQPRLFGPDVNLPYTDLIGANLSGLDLRGDNLQYANFVDANLQGASLRGANLQYADLAGAQLQGADLKGANLQYANLAGANLSGVDFQGASLVYASLSGATLTGLGPSFSQQTNFDGADLFEAQLSGALCGSPSYIVAFFANLQAVDVPAACIPPL
jgi:phosphatidylinositol-3-phosphatase